MPPWTIPAGVSAGGLLGAAVDYRIKRKKRLPAAGVTSIDRAAPSSEIVSAGAIQLPSANDDRSCRDQSVDAEGQAIRTVDELI